jgi:hypothetical protein
MAGATAFTFLKPFRLRIYFLFGARRAARSGGGRFW